MSLKQKIALDTKIKLIVTEAIYRGMYVVERGKIISSFRINNRLNLLR